MLKNGKAVSEVNQFNQSLTEDRMVLMQKKLDDTVDKLSKEHEKNLEDLKKKYQDILKKHLIKKDCEHKAEIKALNKEHEEFIIGLKEYTEHQKLENANKQLKEDYEAQIEKLKEEYEEQIKQLSKENHYLRIVNTRYSNVTPIGLVHLERAVCSFKFREKRRPNTLEELLQTVKEYDASFEGYKKRRR